VFVSVGKLLERLRSEDPRDVTPCALGSWRRGRHAYVKNLESGPVSLAIPERRTLGPIRRISIALLGGTYQVGLTQEMTWAGGQPVLGRAGSLPAYSRSASHCD